MSLSSELIRKISQQVYRRFPEVQGSAPRLQDRQAKNNAAQYTLTFQKRVANPSGGSLERTVRVVVDEQGKILRMSTSR